MLEHSIYYLLFQLQMQTLPFLISAFSKRSRINFDSVPLDHSFASLLFDQISP